MKMKIPVRRSCITLIVLSALVEAITANENETSTVEGRKGRVNGRIVKLYSGYKPDPVLCIEEGFKADPVHCTVFYRCLKSSSGKFTVFKFQCGPGTVYDPETEVCNHPSSTKRSECGGIKSHIEQDNENDIDQHELPSPISTIMPVYTSATNYDARYTTKVPQLSSSELIPSTDNDYINSFTTSSSTFQLGLTTKEVQDINHNLLTYPWTDYKNTTRQRITSSTTSLEKNQPCTSDGFMGDSEDCKKFYRCVSNLRGGFIRYEFLCSEPTVWDDHMQSCNHPWAVRSRRCGRGVINGSEISRLPNNKSTELTEINYGAKLPEITNQESSEISKLKQPSANYGDTLNDIDKYSIEKYQVSYGSPIVDYSTMPNNDKNTGTEGNIHSDEIHNNYNFGQKTTVEATYSTKKVAENSEAQFSEIGRNFICTQSGFVGDSIDCKKFYRCVENGKGSFTKYEFTCSQGTVWDKKLEACNYVWAVKECGGALAGDSLTTVSTFTSSKITSTTILNENVENSYISHSNEEIEPSTTTTVTTPVSLISTTAASNLIEKECTETGFIGDKNDCKKFYRCVENGRGSFTKFEYKCGDGTLWDQNIEACNHAWAVPSCDSAISNSTTHTTGVTTAKTLTTAFLIQSTTPAKGQDNNNYNNAYGPQIDAAPSTPDMDLQKTTLAPTLNEKNNCESTGFMGDTSDCKKFYRCVSNGQSGFIKYEFSCGEGTVWDPEIEACNHAWAVKNCGSYTTLKDKVTSSSINYTYSTTKTSDAVVTTGISPIQTSTQQKEISDYDSGYGQQHSIPTKKPDIDLETTTLKQSHGQTNNCHVSGFIGDINNCNKFYRCVDNGNGGFIQYEFSCGEGTVWDPEIEACNHAWAVKNCGSYIALKDEVTSSSISYTYSSTKTSDSAVTAGISPIQTSTQQKEISDYDTGYGQQHIVPTKRPDIYFETTTLKQSHGQTNNCHVSGFIGNTNNCNKFYRCVDNGNGGFIQYEFSCGEGTVWDPEIEACNHAWAVKHCGGSTPSKENHLTSSTTNVIESNNEYVTQNYIDNNNNADNFTETMTSTVSTTTLITVTNSSNECESSGFIGDNSDCQKFYRCVDNGKGSFVKHEFMCSEGTVWDSTIEACNHKWAVEKCGGNSHSESVETTTLSSQPTSPVTESLATSTLSVTYTTSKMSTHPVNLLPSNDDSGCSSEGYFANPNDCKKFYRCVTEGKDGYTKYEFSCAEGTAWDANTQSCNYISKVEACSSNQNQIILAETKPVHDEQIMESDITKTTTSTSTTLASTTSASTTRASKTSASTTPASTTSASKTSESSTSVSTTIPSTTSTSTTPASTTSVSTTLATATSSTTSKTSNTQPVGENSCKEEGYFGDTNDCKNFYRCVYENDRVFKKYDFTCGDGTIWDQDIITCNHPHDVKNPSCKSISESTSPVSTSSTTTDYNETSSSITTKKPLSTTTALSTTASLSTTTTSSTTTSNKNDTNSNCSNSTTENPNNANMTCPKAGYYADVNNCKKFYRCVDWENNGKKFSIYHFECADGTIWDPALETCNHEDSVYPPRNCNGTGTHQNENTTETSTTERTTTTTNQAESTTTSSEPTKTSTQSTTTSEYPSTQTTQSSTTEKPTSQPSTTQASTTNDSTTQSSTTESSTTEESTTQSSTTEESTTQSSTTAVPSTQISTTQSSTTEESTTMTSTTQSSTTAVPSTQMSTTQSSTTEESTTMTSTTQSSTSAELTTQLSTTEELTTQTSTTQSSTTDESTTQSSTTEESTTMTSTTQSSTTDESTTQSSTTEESTAHSSTTEESTTQSSTTKEHSTSQKTSTTTEKDKEKTTTTTQMMTSATDQTSTTTEPSTTTTEASSSSTTENNQESTTETSMNEKCPDTNANQSLYVCPTSFKRHPKYCNLFYQCVEDSDSHELKIAVFNCPNNTIYDESKIQCVEEKKSSKKCNGQISQKHRVQRLGATQNDLFVVTQESMACENPGHFPFEKHTECSSSLLKCELTKSGHLRGFVYRCPDGFVYWNISRRCEPIKKVRDCKHSSYPWQRRYDIPLERFNIAP